MLFLSIAAPMMARADLPAGQAIEDHHSPDRCPPAHDHSLCVQIGSLHAAPTSGASAVPAAPTRVSLLPNFRGGPFLHGSRPLPRTRAPPRF